MLELIFQGFVEWVYGMILECWEFFASAVLDIMRMDFAYLKLRMPIIDTIMEIFLAVGWALLIGNLVFQAIKTMLSGIGFEGEDPKLLFARTFVFAFLLLASPQICSICLNMTSTIISILEVPDAVNITFADEASFVGLKAAWLLVIICGIIVMFQSFKLIFEMAERYLILAVLTISAPLAFGMGGSRNTSDIFTGWCRMYGSMCLLMVMQVVFIKMLLSILSFYPSGLDVLPWMILVLATVKAAKKIDAIITRIGLNPAITGDSLGRTFPGSLTYMVVRAASSQVTKAIGKTGMKSGKTPNTPSGTSSAQCGRPLFGGIRGGSTAQRNQQNSRQTAAYQSASQQTVSQQGATVQGASVQNTTQEYSNNPTFAAGAKISQSGAAGTNARKTTVPPNSKRAASPSPQAFPSGAIRSGNAGGVTGAPGQTHTSTDRMSNTIPGVSDSGRNNTASNAVFTQSRMAVGEPQGPQPGSAGKGTAYSPSTASVPRSVSPDSRYTQVNNQTTKAGGINSAVLTSEQKRIAVNQRAAKPSAPAGTASGAPVPQNAGQRSSSPQRDARFTRRENTAPQKPATPAPAEKVGGSPKTPGLRQPGPAGIVGSLSSRQTQQPARPGRNDGQAYASTPASVQHSTTRQEHTRSSTPAAATGQSGRQSVNPGIAGSAARAPRPSQSGMSIHQSRVPSHTVPMKGGNIGGKDAASTVSGARKNLTGQTQDKYDRPKRGEKRGRKR